MRWLILLLALIAVSASADQPKIPLTNDVVRYDRISPIFSSKIISKERGDELLALLDGGRNVKDWITPEERKKYICILPVPANLWMDMILTNGTTYHFGVANGGLLYLPEGLYVLPDADNRQLTNWVGKCEADLQREVFGKPKPFVYTLGTVNDGGTLSGVARLFYGDPDKWHQIYEANRSTIKNPNVLHGGEELVIPKL